jgi:hypothetical protein
MSHEREGTKSVIWSQRGQLRESNFSVATINDLYMDTSFSGALQQCDPETCDLLERTMDLKPTIGLDESNTVRYSSPSFPIHLLTLAAGLSTSISSTSTVTAGPDASTASCRPARSCLSQPSSPSGIRTVFRSGCSESAVPQWLEIVVREGELVLKLSD